MGHNPCSVLCLAVEIRVADPDPYLEKGGIRSVIFYFSVERKKLCVKFIRSDHGPGCFSKVKCFEGLIRI